MHHIGRNITISRRESIEFSEGFRQPLKLLCFGKNGFKELSLFIHTRNFGQQAKWRMNAKNN
ncbi:MAG: hypothetical protein KDH98_20580, partial [Calditrichaeota bacterium]|nr:hypothetical protein [Calditrichota bacterium]